jgi:LPS sulfotransferase NodH
MLKRRFREELKARKYWYHVTGIKSKTILYNLMKADQVVITIVVWKELNRTDKSEMLKRSKRL